MNFLPVYVWFVLLSFLASLTVYFIPGKNEGYLKLFPPFLFATLLVEVISNYIQSLGKPNISWYNVFTVVEFCFYLWIMRLLIRNEKVRRAILWPLILYPVAAAANIIFLLRENEFHSVTYSIGCLLIVSFCIYYFLELFRLPKSVELKNNPSFWICSGLLFFYCCGFPMYGFINYLAKVTPIIIENFYTIYTILNIFLYSLFAIAFLCRIKARKYIS